MKIFSPDPGRNIRLWLNSFLPTYSHKEIRYTKRVLFIQKKINTRLLVVCDRLLIVAAVGPESMPYPDNQPLFLKSFIFHQRIQVQKRGG